MTDDGWGYPLVVRVEGWPVAQARAGRRVIVPAGGGRPFVRSFDPAKSADWKRTVMAQVLARLGTRAPMAAGPVMVLGTFYLIRPKSLPKRVLLPDRRPDLDNLEKSVLDALTGLCYRDDGQVVDKQFRKRYTTDRPGVELWIGRPFEIPWPVELRR